MGKIYGRMHIEWVVYQLASKRFSHLMLFDHHMNLTTFVECKLLPLKA